VYVAEVEVTELKVPQALPEQLEPETVHVTPLPEESLLTVAASTTDWETVNPYSAGVTATVICAWGSGDGAGVKAVGGTGAETAKAIGEGSGSPYQGFGDSDGRGRLRSGVADITGNIDTRSAAIPILQTEYPLA
jgi:hypothetical protein